MNEMDEQRTRINRLERGKLLVELFIERFGAGYRRLARLAALPLVLTPELLGYLHREFLYDAGLGHEASADLLLSELCREIGYEQYVMDRDARAWLLKEMEEQDNGASLKQEVAGELLDYVGYLARTNPALERHELEAQEWAAMAYLDAERKQAVRELVRAFNHCLMPSPAGGPGLDQRDALAEAARLSRIVEQDLGAQLAGTDCEALLDYARTVGRILNDRAGVVADGPAADAGSSRRFEIPGVPETPAPIETVRRLKTEGFVHAVERFDSALAPFEFETVNLDPKGGVKRRKKGRARQFVEELGPGVILEMVEIPGGEFQMGSPKSEQSDYDDERPQCKVNVPPFYIGKFTVTQAQWRAVSGFPKVKTELEPSPSYFKGDDRPVERVSWEEAAEFCARLAKKTGREYRLPSESEWEYACRAGTSTPFAFGETITSEFVNYDGNHPYGEGPTGKYRKETVVVGSLGVANRFGLYDMHGNVWEWCEDVWHHSYKDAPGDGRAWREGGDETYRVVRGGSWDDDAADCRSAFRDWNTPFVRYNNFGFRVVAAART